MPVPADSHVHSEWSWDAFDGSMEQTCARAVELGLPAVAFTDHMDFTVWRPADGELDQIDRLEVSLTPDGVLAPPEMDVDGYLNCVEHCRERFPDLRIITGVELGEAHRNAEAAARLLGSGQFERVNGSLHCLPVGEEFLEPTGLYRLWPTAKVIEEYLAEIPRMIQGSDLFGVLAHIDYPVRYWPAEAPQFNPQDFEDEFRQAMRAVADSGRALELNTSRQLNPWIVQWWRDEGGRAVTFGSDSHDPDHVGQRFADATALAEAHGFRPSRPYDFWTR